MTVTMRWRGTPFDLTARVTTRSTRWLLLLHGLQSDHRLFDAWCDDPRFREYSLIAPDLIGFGHSTISREFSYSLRTQAELVAGLLIAQQIPAVTIVGHSLGSMVGTLMLQQQHVPITGLVSLEGNLQQDDCGVSAQWATMSVPQLAAHVEVLLDQLRHETATDWTPRIRALRDTPAFVLQRTSAAILESVATDALYQTFTTATVPRLLVRGADSHFSSTFGAPTLTTATIPNAGHFMLLEQPDATRRVVAEWVERIR